MIAEAMDLPTILAWRRTCAINYAHATAALKRTLTMLLNPFLSQPAALLGSISRYGAVIGGEVALAFIRRHRPFQPQTLEIFVGASLYQLLCRELLSHPQIVPDIIDLAVTILPHPHNLQRDILETTHIHLRAARTLRIHRSSTLSPISPITRSICTAMVNFITPHCFGCAYPRLTLDDKALLSDLSHDIMSDFDASTMRVLAEQGIDVAVDPATWKPYRMWSPNPTLPNSTTACWRSHYICPEQGRFFGDHGSLIDFIDPLGTSMSALQGQGLPPFGTAVVWRLASSYRCPSSCEAHDSTLPVGQTSIAIILIGDPFIDSHRGRQRRPRIRRELRRVVYSAEGRNARSISL